MIIVSLGGHIENGRVDGMLSVTRAFGDPLFKTIGGNPASQKVIAIPEIHKIKASEGDFLLMSCDGIFEANEDQEVFTRQSVVNFVASKLVINDDPGLTCGLLLHESMRRGELSLISATSNSFF